MVRKLLLYGMLVGLAAGLLAFLVAKTIGEPSVDKAISFEGVVAASHHETEEADLVSRSVQNTAGLGAGVIIYGVSFGGIFALVFALAYGRIGALTARGTAAALGVIGFVSVFLMPFLKYPANPPSVGDPDTIKKRTALYLAMILLSVAAAVVAVIARRHLRERIGDWYATVAVGAAYLVVMLVAFVAMPGINEVPQQALQGVTGAVTDAGITFPTVVLWRFRTATVAIQAITWATIAVGFGYLATRALERDTRVGLPESAPVV
jgi:pimeloyl-ACP methyl ester carboxylesterase